MKRIAVLSVIATALSAGPLCAQTPLPMGTTGPGVVMGDGGAVFAVSAQGPGFLTVVARSANGEDIRLAITDDEGQVLPQGQVDADIGGNGGAEQAVVVLPYAGSYQVRVETFDGGGAAFSIGGSFLASALVGGEPDPDGKPSKAQSLAVTESHSDVLDGAAGDMYDWYRIEATTAGVLTVLTRAEGEEGDLRLELFMPGAFTEAVETSDQDQGGVLGNESATLDVQAGQVVFVRVGPSFAGSGARAAYRIASGLIPG